MLLQLPRRTCRIPFALLIAAVTLMPLVGEAQAPPKASGDAAKVDLNTASQKALEDLPGVGPATAKKIIAGRPYAAVADLAKAGVPAKTIEKLAPLVMVGRAPAAAAPAPVAAAPPPAPPKPAAKTAPVSSAGVAAQVPPVKGMVWVNLETKVFHREGDRYYGKTKKGQFMPEADALKAGYRESKQGVAKQK